MTEEEWQSSTRVLPMLVYLRGHVKAEEAESTSRLGDLVAGDGELIDARQLGHFATKVTEKWWDLPLDDRSRNLIKNYEVFLSGRVSWSDYISVCAQSLEAGDLTVNL